MIWTKKKKNLTAVILALLPVLAALAFIWFEYYGPSSVKDEAWALSTGQDCQTLYDKAAWSQEWLPPEGSTGDYVIYRYNYASCPYKNDAQREKFLTYGSGGNLTLAGNLGIIGGQLVLNKQLADLSFKTYSFDGYASSTVYYRQADKQTIFSSPHCTDPSVYNQYANATILDKIASSTIFLEQGNSTVFDQCVNWAAYDAYANSADYDAYTNPNLTIPADSHKGLAIVSDKTTLLALYGAKQRNDLNVKFNLPAEARSASAAGVVNKVSGDQTRWIAGTGPYVGHCLVKKSEAGGPACTADNCPGACPAIDCETMSSSQCKVDRWTWDESCSYYTPAMDQYQFIKTGEESYECGQEEFGCFGSGIYNCGQDKNCGNCWQYTSQTCIRILGYNKCISSKCVKQEQDCRVGRALLGQPE